MANGQHCLGDGEMPAEPVNAGDAAPAADSEEDEREVGRRTGARPKRAAKKAAAKKAASKKAAAKKTGGRPRTRATTAALKRDGGEPSTGWGGRLRPRRR